ncbi:hypothetical protein BC629DRAFT_1540109 [Irpex lacteus]|nr:hypothetical protein BC629DRAFT_1540109 [Irpex lacteus]
MRTLVRPGILPYVRRKKDCLAIVRPNSQHSKTAIKVWRREEIFFPTKSSGLQFPKRGRSRTIKPMFASEVFKQFRQDREKPWFEDKERCLSPTLEDLPEVMSVASSYDGQMTVSREKSMTVVLIEILESRNMMPMRTRKLNQHLNREMRDLRCEVMGSCWTDDRIRDRYLRVLRQMQQPVIGSLSPLAPGMIFGF